MKLRWPTSDSFLDLTNGLIWQKYNLCRGYKFSKQNDILDSWSDDPAIREFVAKRGLLSVKFTAMLSERNGLYYAYLGDKLVGACVVAKATKCYDIVTIEYLVVDPKLKDKGIATRMVMSIRQNPKEFSDFYNGKIDAYVDKKNAASKRVFIKNKFKVYKRPEDMEMLGGFYRLYYDERIKE